MDQHDLILINSIKLCVIEYVCVQKINFGEKIVRNQIFFTNINKKFLLKSITNIILYIKIFLLKKIFVQTKHPRTSTQLTRINYVKQLVVRLKNRTSKFAEIAVDFLAKIPSHFNFERHRTAQIFIRLQYMHYGDTMITVKQSS